MPRVQSPPRVLQSATDEKMSLLTQACQRNSKIGYWQWNKTSVCHLSRKHRAECFDNSFIDVVVSLESLHPPTHTYTQILVILLSTSPFLLAHRMNALVAMFSSDEEDEEISGDQESAAADDCAAAEPVSERVRLWLDRWLFGRLVGWLVGWLVE